MPEKKDKVDIEAKHVDITSEYTTDKIAADKIEAARIAAEVKATDAEIAAQVKKHDAQVAKEVRATEVETAAAARRLEWWKVIALPVMIALIACAVSAIPNTITAWNQSYELREIKQTGKDTHSLVNSRMTAQLKISAAALRAVARLTMNDDDIAAAELAEKMLYEQERAQKQLDAGNKGE